MTTRISRPARAAGMAGLGLLLAAPLQGQATPAVSDTLPTHVLEAVTVTARRTPELRASVPQRVEVVTRTDLERTVGTDVTEALKKNATVDVIQYSGLLSGVSIRGFRPQFSGINQRTLVLLDGRPAGATNLSTLDVAAVERIEVLRGPASALYGSSAMGGVVNIVTRRSSGAVGGSVRGSYGSFRTYRGELNAGGTLAGALDFDLALAAAGRGDGYRTGSRRTLGGETIPKSLSSGRTVQVTELTRDTTLDFTRFATRSGSLRLGYALGERWSAHARAGFFTGDDVQNPGDLHSAFPWPTLNDLARYTGETGVAGQVGRHALTLRGYAAREVTSYYDDAQNPSYFSSRSPNRWLGAQLQDVVRLGAHSLTAGLDYTRASAASEVFSAPGQTSPPYAPNSAIHSAAAFAEGKLSLLQDRLVATLGGRLDRVTFEIEDAVLFNGARVTANSEANTVFNPSAGLLYRAPAGVRLHASAGRAFVTPEAFNVAGYAEMRVANRRVVNVTRGNPELQPEHSVTWDAGVGLSRPRQGVELDLTYFQTDVRNRISFVPVPQSGVRLTGAGDTIRSESSYANSERAEIRGLEGSASYDLGAASGFARSLRLFASATHFLRAEETTAGATTDIKNVAGLTTLFGAEYDDLRRFSTRLSGRYVGERLDTDFSDFSNLGDVRYPEFLVFDLSAAVRVSPRYRLGVLLGNLTDESYYEVRGYTLPGRNLQISLGASF